MEFAERTRQQYSETKSADNAQTQPRDLFDSPRFPRNHHETKAKG
jgi:hypothetical protein